MNITVKRAIYLCSCTREFVADQDIPKFCPICRNTALSRISKYQADRTLINGRIYYDELPAYPMEVR